MSATENRQIADRSAGDALQATASAALHRAKLAEDRAAHAQQVTAGLTEALALIESVAREAWIVCGTPSTDEGFYRAWQQEEPERFATWIRLCDLRDQTARVFA